MKEQEKKMKAAMSSRAQVVNSYLLIFKRELTSISKGHLRLNLYYSYRWGMGLLESVEGLSSHLWWRTTE